MKMNTITIEAPPEIMKTLAEMNRKIDNITSHIGNEPEYLTVNQAAERLGVTAGTVRRWVKKGRMPFTRTGGGHMRFKPIDIEEMK